MGDLIGLMDTLSIDDAIIAGNDWGATIAWQMALMRPDRIRGVMAFGVPMMSRPPIAPTRIFPRTNDAQFYTLYFQEPGVAERELEHDVLATLRKIYHAASGEAGARQPGDGTPNPFGMVAPGRGMLRALPEPAALPDWLSAADLESNAALFARSGFRGGLNYYRNLDRNWRLQASLEGLRIDVPALLPSGPAMSDCRCRAWTRSLPPCPASFRTCATPSPSTVPGTGYSRSGLRRSMH